MDGWMKDARDAWVDGSCVGWMRDAWVDEGCMLCWVNELKEDCILLLLCVCGGDTGEGGGGE